MDWEAKWTEKEINYLAEEIELIAKGTIAKDCVVGLNLGTRYTNIILDDFESEVKYKNSRQKKRN